MTIQKLLQTIRSGNTLSEKEMTHFIDSVLDGHATPAQIGAFLMGISQRGETVEEITGAAKILRKRAAAISAPDGVIDCCGTGGDHSNSLNISTAVSFVVAACGIPVAKHGNRAASSKSGAADVLEHLGINLDLTPEQCAQALKDIGFCFLMAPHHHTSLKPLAALRKELGFRTIFNLLGPLANPADTKLQLLGVFDKNFVRPMAEALKSLGSTRAWVVHGSDGMDEITLTAPTHVAKLENSQITETILTPDDFGLPTISAQDIAGGNAAHNAVRLEDLLNGEKDAYRDIVLANAAACLMIAKKAETLKNAVELASKAIDTGAAMKLMTDYKNFTNERP
ncbi:MAG TPA: anthranilate phosphoribosyltransferase [Alphaproteobacteria bacterium]|nr:anthranilate phosphoribosyltransferase [Alphaproteobacteria bacterium]